MRKCCRVIGDSMKPTLYEGNIVVYRPTKRRTLLPEVGSIVIVEDPLQSNFLIIKRVVLIKDSGVELKGDNENESIDSRNFGIVHSAKILGIVENVIKNPFLTQKI